MTKTKTFDFTAITSEQETLAVAKFRDNGVGINLSRHGGAKLLSKSGTKYDALTDPSAVQMSTIKEKLIEIAVTLTTTPNDPILGNLGVAYTTKNFKGESVTFTFEDAYLFLRSAFGKRKESAEYIRKQKELADLKKYLDDNKSQEEVLAEKKAQFEKLQAELG